MSNRKVKKPAKGFVVDHKESPVRYAVSLTNFNPKIHTKVRELEQHETVQSFRPKRIGKTASASEQAPSTEGSLNTDTK